jgi:hypothetical protein
LPFRRLAKILTHRCQRASNQVVPDGVVSPPQQCWLPRWSDAPVAMVDLVVWFAWFAEGFRSDCSGKFSESCCETQTFTAGVTTEFVVPAAQVLNKGMAADHV